MSANAAIESFKRNFNVNTDFADVSFRKFNVDPYDALPQNHQFGEKICLLYRLELKVFNIDVFVRILAFKYETHAEVLKLEIKVCNELLSKEIAACKNFVQRKRNLNLAFEVIIKYARLFEMRRLICLTVFQKRRNIATLSDDDGVIVKCCNDDFSVNYLELNWSIMWKVDNYEVSDFIEFYFNYSVLTKESADSVKRKLEVLVEPSVDFHAKLKLWKSLMDDLYGCIPQAQSTTVLTKSTDVLEISDSDSDVSVIELENTIYERTSSDEIMVID